jgi:hypothetical protein
MNIVFIFIQFTDRSLHADYYGAQVWIRSIHTNNNMWLILLVNILFI